MKLRNLALALALGAPFSVSFGQDVRKILTRSRRCKRRTRSAA